MITLKTGVPGSGKTLSMVSELLELHEKSKKDGSEPRPVYTNITGLAIPHVFLTDCTQWRQCPPNSIIVIDEAFLFGYDAKSSQSNVPDYIRDLAVHRKDYSVDIIFIAQHPKLLHVALRRQVGKHQHYRRLFGWGRAVCYEWDSAQDNLAATKTAVMTNFNYRKDVFKAYKSAEVHTKPKFKLPWFFWIPVALVPLAAWAMPTAYGALSGTMSGQGLSKISSAAPPAPASSAPLALQVPKVVAPAPAPAVAVPVLAPPGRTSESVDDPLSSVAGCIVVSGRCGCFDTAGKKVEVERAICSDVAGEGRSKPVDLGPDSPKPVFTDADLDAIRFAMNQKPKPSSSQKAAGAPE